VSALLAAYLAMLAAALLAVLYLAVLAAAAFRFRKQVAPPAAWPPLLVVIPAHDEEGQVADTVRSVLACDYPADRLAVLVLADNCSDATAAAAASAGARVVERRDPERRGKGQALDWLFRERSEALDGFAAVAVVDADSRLDPAFAREMASSLAAPGASVVQGFYGVLNPGDSWRTRLIAAALCVFHHLRPAGREAMGGTAGLRGNGMGFSAEVLRRLGWPAGSVVEDAEFSLILLLEGIRVRYNPDAVVLAEMAVTGRQATSQRRRWEAGRAGLLAAYGLRLGRRVFGPGGLAMLDALADLAVPPLAVLVLGLAALTGIAWFWHPPTLPLCLAGDASLAAFVLCGLAIRRANLATWLALFAAPVYILWKVPLYAAMLLTRRQGWIRTRRKSER